MTDVIYTVAAGEDDGRAQIVTGSFYNNSNAWIDTPSTGSTILQNFIRFDNVTIPSGVEITACVLRVIAYQNKTITTSNAIIYCEDADDPAAPTNGTDVISRVLTSGTSWSNIPAWTGGNSYDSVDFTNELQAVIERPGWNSGQAVIVNVIDNSSSIAANRQAASYDHVSYDPPKLVVTYEALLGTITESFGITDEVDAFSLTDSLSDDFGISDQVDAQLMAGPIADSFGISDEVDAGFEFLRDVADSFGISDVVEGFLETPKDFDDSYGFTDEVDAFNYSAWLRENRTRAKQRFFFTLTGAADSTTDIEIPASSIYARKRSGDPTYLQVTVPSFNYAAQISTRSNGTMIVDIAYVVEGEISLRERILEAELGDISTYEGANSRSIILSGHKTVTYGSQLISIDKSLMAYRGYQSKSRNFRFAIIDAYLNPSDTLVVGAESMNVNNIVYIINSESTSMEVSEAS